METSILDASQLIADMAAHEGGRCLLDTLHLPYAQAGGGPAAKFGLGVELFLPDRDRAVLRRQAFDWLVDYWDSFPREVDEYLRDDARRPKRFKGSPAASIRADIDRVPVDAGYTGALFGRVDIGLEKDDIPPYQAAALISRATDPRLSFLDASMPSCSSKDEQRFTLLLEAVLRWSAMVQPVHGSAGFRFIVASGMSQNSRLALQMLERFPGFDFPDTVGFSMRAKAVHDRIKCVNWLTILADPLVAQLGGAATLAEALGGECRLHAYAGGTVIQAGPEPRLGDAARGDVPEAYRTAARVTRPIRFMDYADGIFRVPDGRDKRQTTLDWVSRFD